MRIVINGPPKQGHRWLKCLLAGVYGLKILGGSKTPQTRPSAFADWIAAGGFTDDTIFHQHMKFSPRLADAIAAAPAHLVTVIRDPYDTFVSLYYWEQDRTAHGEIKDQERPRNAVGGKPLDHPDVLAYLAGDFALNLARANDWLRSGRATVVRYEDLHRDPTDALTRAVEQIAPATPDRIVDAVEACRAENLRQASEKWARHVRSATVGDSKQRLGEAHLAIFRERHADLIHSLGYSVR